MYKITAKNKNRKKDKKQHATKVLGLPKKEYNKLKLEIYKNKTQIYKIKSQIYNFFLLNLKDCLIWISG